MPLYKTFGVDLGTSMIKIYSAQNDSILKEKNMIAIRNENQILASGNEAYKICLRLKKGLIIQSEIPREKIKFIWLKNRLPMQYHWDFQLIIQAEV